MLKKIFKTILVLSLCVGISLPTNAAVSVSDGSAFVTKAEFAADLNNLSNRMAQLENSLDAKIDSLVSSYLTRNGIWNGAKQTLVQDSFVIYYDSYNYCFANNNNDNPYSYSLLKNRKFLDSSDYTDIIDPCTKSGMCVFEIVTDTNTRAQWMSESGGYKGHSGFSTFFSIFDKTKNVESSSSSFGIINEAVGPNWQSGRLGVVVYKATMVMQFFVSKGDIVAIDYRLTGSWRGGPYPAVSAGQKLFGFKCSAYIY